MEKLTAKIIDPHLHLFNLQKGHYQWLKPENPPHWSDKPLINQNVCEADLHLGPDIQLQGFVHIEAGFDNQRPWREIDWLEQHCTLPFKTVAFADLHTEHFAETIERLMQRKSVAGIRHILEGQDSELLFTKNTAQHFALLQDKQLSFDAQLDIGDSRIVNQLLKLATTFDRLAIIINHGGWPPINTKSSAYQKWIDSIQRLANCSNIAIKLSGWEMIERKWPSLFLQDTLLSCLTHFGHSRVMLASNFPLCKFSRSYQELWQSYLDLVDIIDADCIEQITYKNAVQWYGF